MSTWRPSEDHERFHIDSGPRINALQVISEALDIPQQQDDEDSCQDSNQGQNLLNSDNLYNSSSASTTKTIVASDGDVSNGFVKSGRSLPYVFEASESGIRKRSSKILPVCAVCGKRFVCVTTMKRHLVTHTGEKPFSCKVCGKQYTQKGNLRVHERTHRNDRPFECNICHQKFYRKEPMQKHQWRQHGIVHFKSRPTNCTTEQNPGSSTPTPDIQTPLPQPQQPQQAAPAASLQPPTPLSLEPPKPLIALRPAKPTSYTALVDSLRASSRENSPYRSDPPPFAPPAAHQTQIDVPKFTPSPPSSSAPALPQSLTPHLQPPVAVVKLPLPEQLEFKHAKCSSSSATAVSASLSETSSISISALGSSSTSPPMSSLVAPGSTPPTPAPPSVASLLANHPQSVNISKETAAADAASNHQESNGFSYSSILNETPNTHLLIVPAATTIEPISQSSSSSPSASSSTSTNQSEHQAPIKLKMKMAYQAYQAQEQQQQQQQQLQLQEQEQEHQQQQVHVHNLDNDLNEMKLGANEMVECQCKTCGNTFSVVDPYNFRCNNCNVKYTSLPTHLIADPLQCIGCCAVFPHKPALKAHQTVSDKERPFRCCKCGYGFRQKAHLQKHQWRIHRRKLEPDPSMKEAEAFFEVIRSSSSGSSSSSSIGSNSSSSGSKTSTTITMQDIINKSVEKSIGEGPRNLMKTSSKYYSEVLGLEYEPKSSSEDDDSRDQPLDLSPAKKLASRENNPLLNQPPLPPQQSNNNPNSINNQEQLVVEQQATSSSPPATTVIQLNHDQYPGTWKKQKTSIATHSTLPPISGLQKPMSFTVKNHYKHSSWISSSTSGSSVAPSVTSSEPPSSHHQPIELIGGSATGKSSENNSFVRSQLELLKSSNARTV